MEAHSWTSPPCEEDAGIETPFADAVQRVTATGAASFHALPISGGRSLLGSRLRGKYQALLGSSYLSSEVSYGATMIDSFFRPRACLAEAQRLAAQAFGADYTYFLTCGTTVTNEIALDALSARNARVLADRTCHQSIHFGLDRLASQVTYCRTRACCAEPGHALPDMADLVARFRAAAQAGRPFDMVVLTAASYDGVLVDMHATLTELLTWVDELTVLVDEAWSAILAFHPGFRHTSALPAARQVLAEMPGKRLRMLVTQSAHKSMSALRQGSYLHVVGGEELADAAAAGLYRYHSTSPSLPILASLDLARAQAQMEGEALVERSMESARVLRTALENDTRLSGFVLGEPPAGAQAGLLSWDPTKVLIDLSEAALKLGVTRQEMRSRLFRDYGLYFSRVSNHGMLANMHIGVTPETVSRLLASLRGMSDAFCARRASRSGGRFLIAYPPGIPLALPGEPTATGAVLEHAAAGTELFCV